MGISSSKKYDNVKKIECGYYKQLLSLIITPENVVYPVPVDDIVPWKQCNDIKINVLELDGKEEKLIFIYESLEKILI